VEQKERAGRQCANDSSGARSIEQTVSAEAVVSCGTGDCTEDYVDGEEVSRAARHPREKGAIALRIGKRRLIRRSRSSKGDFEREASYATTVGAGLTVTDPKAELMPRRQNPLLMHSKGIRQPEGTFQREQFRDAIRFRRSRAGTGAKSDEQAQRQLADLQSWGQGAGLESAHGS
jgi:hypothetical protein